MPKFFSFFNFNIFEKHFVTKVYLCFRNQHIILDFLIPNMTYFKKKDFTCHNNHFQIFGHKTRNKEETAQNKGKYIF
jgi:hypothetical protein